MFVSKQLKESNIAEYLLYMWQVEDMIRANGMDMERISQTLVAPARLDAEREAQLVEWYENLIEMMRMEGVSERGHLQIKKKSLPLQPQLRNKRSIARLNATGWSLRLSVRTRDFHSLKRSSTLLRATK